MKTDLTITRIHFFNFRNYPLLELDNLKSLVIIVGDNALGKTNIIEGVQLVSMIESFRKPTWSDVIQKQSDCAHVAIEYCRNGCDNRIVLDVRDNKRYYEFNEKPKRPRDLCGLLPAVLFTPGDLLIVQGSSEQRRSCVDDLGCQMSRTFVDIKQDYARVVKQKNAVLREEYLDAGVLDSWNRNLVKLGTSLMVHRVALFRLLMEKTREIYHQIAPAEQFSARYVPSWMAAEKRGPKEEEAGEGEEPFSCGYTDGPVADEVMEREKKAKGEASSFGGIDVVGVGEAEETSRIFSEALERYQQQEIRSKRSFIGPHRDEISFFIDGDDARRFGSQGQQRSIALALKIAEVEVLREVTGVDPILLLDDVMSEIDVNRREMLLDLIDTTTQTFITTTNLGYFDKRALKRAQIIRLPLGMSQKNLREETEGV